MPLVFASDPAPQQLTAPCHKYRAACTSLQSNRCTGFDQLIFLELCRDLSRFCHGRAYGTVDAITKLILPLVFVSTHAVSAQDRNALATLQGTVFDARTGSPLPKILVVVEGGASTETGPDGRFNLPDLMPGSVRLYVSAVGYGLVQRTFQLTAGSVLDVRVPLTVPRFSSGGRCVLRRCCAA
jgi:Carboxypeptidase regulatory-like domain